MAIKREKGTSVVTAIVPAYNEQERIASVLNSLCQSSMIKEIIVVDDGSTDGTKEVVSRFREVKCLRNTVNRGKGFSLQRGVEAARGDIIFFCDADLAGFEPKIVEEIVSPVLNEEFDMFVGARDHKKNIFAKTFVLLEYKWGIYPTTGQRALRRDIWEKLPEFYKRNYKTEVGLNYFVKRRGRGFGFKKFSYCHRKKERKFGILKGLFIKLNMYFDVISASLRAKFVDRFSARRSCPGDSERKSAQNF